MRRVCIALAAFALLGCPQQEVREFDGWTIDMRSCTRSSRFVANLNCGANPFPNGLRADSQLRRDRGHRPIALLHEFHGLGLELFT